MNIKGFFTLKDEASDMSVGVLGGKGFGLVEMSRMGVRVPPAVIIPTNACKLYQVSPKEAMSVIAEQLPAMKAYLSESFGYMPLVAVRSGAPVSMPGMMDTILNVGLNYGNEPVWASRIGGMCAESCRIKLESMYQEVVGESCPSELDAQLLGAIEAVFKSWNNQRAIDYRNVKGISHDLGTAVVIQAMVFGNYNENSCSGTLDSRNTNTGANEVTGEFAVGIQGEDLVAGKVAGQPLSAMPAWNNAVAVELLDVVETLEQFKRDVVDVEFTVQDGVLYLLQVRVSQRTAQAALQIAVDMEEEGLISAIDAVKRVKLNEFLNAGTVRIDPEYKVAPTLQGEWASVGVAKGVAVSPKDAVNCQVDYILVADETTPEDFAVMAKAKGILTRRGGATAHAAVVARGMNKPCVVNCQNLPALRPGLVVTIDGGNGNVWLGQDVPLVDAANLPSVAKFKALIRKAYNFMKIVSNVAELPVEEGYFVTNELDNLDVSNMKSVLTAVVKKMKRGIIDLTSDYQMADPVDQKFLAAFGISEKDGWSSLDTKVFALRFAADQVDMKSKDIWIIFGDQAASQELEAKGYKVVPKINTLEQLIMAKELGVLEASFDKPTQKLLELKAKAGEPFEAMFVAREVDESVFRPGVRVAVTELAAAQSLLMR